MYTQAKATAFLRHLVEAQLVLGGLNHLQTQLIMARARQRGDARMWVPRHNHCVEVTCTGGSYKVTIHQ